MKYTLQSVHEELLELMKRLHSYCAEYKIDYSLSGGSLLGAIRHQGFIPWDDDLDILMTRENFEKLRWSYQGNEINGCVLERDQWVYRVRKNRRESGYIPSIDIFILDTVPGNPFVRNFQLFLLRFLQGMLRNNEKEGEYSIIYRVLIAITAAIGKLFNPETLFRWYDRVSQWGNRRKSGKVSLLDDRFSLIGLQYDANLADAYQLHAFEDAQFQIISRYEEYLTAMFGDYMRLPPESERVPQHIF